jgi:hypothetical protein
MAKGQENGIITLLRLIKIILIKAETAFRD